jgi:hypothetical protein
LRLTTGPPRHIEGGEGHTLDRSHHEMRQVIIRQPGLQIRWKQERLVAVEWNEVRHAWMLARISKAV